MRIELDVDLRPEKPQAQPKPGVDPKAGTERQRRAQEERFLRRIALAQVIETHIAAGEFADLADVAHRCSVSRARISALVATAR